jgi:phosphate butyryltransferase
MSNSFFEQLSGQIDKNKKCRVAIPFANDEACAYAVSRAIEANILEATLIGNPEAIKLMYGSVADSAAVSIIDIQNEQEACARAVEEVKTGRSHILMKGLVSTSTILKAVLSSKTGIKKNPLLSHLCFFELPDKSGLKILTDAAMTIAPDSPTLVSEIENAVEALSAFSKKTPKVALLSANEKVSDKIESTKLAEEAAKAFSQNKKIIVEGPVSFDLAVSPSSAQIKKYAGKIQGDADILVVPRLDTGNALYKALQYYVNAQMGGMLFGAQCPVVLTSRADSNDTKYNSLLLGITIWQNTN